MHKNDIRIINAWCSYDIANSAYNLVITATIFPIYYQETTSKVFNNSLVPIGNMMTRTTVLYDFFIALAYLIIIIISPLLSGIADWGGLKKFFMRSFTYIGSIACILLFDFDGRNIYYGLTLASIAVIGYAGSLVFYNSFLPVIATPDKHDRISARGFAMGYLGSMLLLILLLLFINSYSWFGMNNALEAVRITFPIVGIWWLVIAHIAFTYLKEKKETFTINGQVILKGYKEIIKVWQQIKGLGFLKKFLFTFFLFSLGVQTILLVAALFGKVEIGISGPQLILTIIIIQVVAMLGSLIFGEVSTRRGNKFSLLWMIGIWMLVCLFAWKISTATQFFILAGGVGLVMGGIQSQARSTYAKLIPDEKDSASYFSFYDITEKAAIVCGMLLFGILEHFTGNMRWSALMLGGVFLLAWIVLAFTKFPSEKKQ